MRTGYFAALTLILLVSPAGAAVINQITNVDTALELDWQADWTGGGFAYSPTTNWSWGFTVTGGDLVMVDPILGAGFSGAHHVGPHGEAAPNPLPEAACLGYDPGDTQACINDLLVSHESHFDHAVIIFSEKDGRHRERDPGSHRPHS